MKIIIYLCIGILPIYIIVIINYIVDPYGVFESNLLNKHGAIQERYYKINFLKKKEFDSIILGSSRVGPINPETIYNKFNINIYNFYISSGNMAEFEYIINWIPGNLPHLKTIYLQIDWPENYGLTGNYLHYQMHPDVINSNRFDFFKSYLFQFQYEALRHKLVRNFTNNHDGYKFDFNYGNFSYPQRDYLLNIDCEQYQNKTGYFNLKISEKPESSRQKKINKDTLESIARLKDFALKNNLNLIFFTAPHNFNFINQINLNEYIDFIIELSKITDFHNFLFYNNLTSNNCNYYEYSHYTDTVSSDIFYALTLKSNLYYSRYTTFKSIDDEIRYLSKNFKKYRG